MQTILATLVTMIFSCVSSLASAACPTSTLEVEGLGQCLKIKTFTSPELSDTPNLLVVIHGDSPFRNPDYQYLFAERIAQSASNLVSVGLLRPGYTDPQNRESDGIRGETVGDNYDDQRVAVMIDAIQTLKNYYHANEVTLVGHSGGAAIVGKILALSENLAQKAVLVSCPCDLKAWRADMFKDTKLKAFAGDLAISSPLDLVDRVPTDLHIKIVVGDNDHIAKPYLSRIYFNALKHHAVKDLELIELKGEHDILNTEPVSKIVTDLVAYQPGSSPAEAKTTSERRAKGKYFVLANYAPVDLFVPGKYGATIGYIRDADQTWELEYLRGTKTISFVVDDLGEMTDQRLSLMGRSYFNTNSFNLSYGLSYFDFLLHLGNEQLTRSQASADLVRTQSLGFNIGVGNRWAFSHNIALGCDWISWTQPVYITHKDSAYLDQARDQDTKEGVETALKVISYFPRFSLLKIQLGILF